MAGFVYTGPIGPFACFPIYVISIVHLFIINTLFKTIKK